ncbi:hypothetical protein [Bacillus sp. SRB1LM]|uniref:hypothetical protein n=1 Tax=Bacillus sp. SRB1LM TaxID=2608688 RepID=UPI0018C3F12E|nr:hypothetical protein [Bacillus sp. SRB1LM]MBG0962452.1 hypothetical protein [Bacillus sp. SRB1LM]
MTLIAGIILPNGVLMMSDTLVKQNGEDLFEYGRKITRITPTTLLASSGTGYIWGTAQALRMALYASEDYMTIADKREIILSKYKQMHEHYLTTDDTRIFGHFLIAEYNRTNSTYTLLTNKSEDPRCIDKLTEYNEIKDIAVNGAIPPITDAVKSNIQELLSTYSSNDLNEPFFHRKISKVCREIFKYYSYQNTSFNDKLHCVYLTTRNGLPYVDNYLCDSDGKCYDVDTEREDAEVIYKK